MFLTWRTTVTLLQAPGTENLGKDGEKREKGNRINSEEKRTRKDKNNEERFTRKKRD